MIFNRIALVLALFVAVLGSQFPEFAQQYRQRLGGALDELDRIIQQFDSDAATRGMNSDQGIGALEANSDPFVRGRGVQMREIESRRDRLARQLQDLSAAKPLSGFLVLARNLDSSVASNVLSDFKPAVPLTFDGLLSALIGFLAGLSAIHLCAWPIRRHYRRRLAHRRALTT
jgi:hypothetical protein